MFAGIISRDDGDPWGPTGMTSKKWLSIPARPVRIKRLILTQDGVYFHSLIEPQTPVGGDEYPHVIQWNQRLYLEDGHHRVVRAAMQGYRLVMARVLTLD